MRLKSSCGCMSLQAGSIILATLNIVSAIGSTILLSMAMGDSRLSRPGGDTALLVWFVLLGVDIYVIITAIFAGLTIFGSIRRHPGYVFPWTALTFSSLVANMAVNLAAAIIFAVALSVSQVLAGIAYIGLTTSLQIYFWLIVYSHYRELMAEHHGSQPRPGDGKVFNQPMNPYYKVETPPPDYRGIV